MSLAVGFKGDRLVEARKARALTATDLGAMIDVSSTSISKYENGHQVPRIDTVDKLALTLAMPRSYFFRGVSGADSKPVFFRSKLTAQTAALDRAKVRLEWFKEVVDFLGSYFDYPQLDLPYVDLPRDPLAITTDMIETAAAAVRQQWGIKPGPMPDVLEKVEASGILVSRIYVDAEKVDAFSQWSDRHEIPFIMLSRDKASAVRQRFDALHELFHILAHRHVTPAHLNNRQTYKLLESQANNFASFVLLPESDFVDELYAPTLDGLLSMKERWGTSVAAMIMRCKSLDLLDDADSKRMWINYTRRGWRKGEPFDGKLEKETPHLIRRSFEMLLERDVFTVQEIRDALPFPVKDLEEMADLEAGTLGGLAQSRVEPRLKTSSDNVVSIFGRD